MNIPQPVGVPALVPYPFAARLLPLACCRVAGFPQYGVHHALRNGHSGSLKVVPCQARAGLEGAAGVEHGRLLAPGGRPPGGPPVRAGNTIFPLGVCLNRAHNFWTCRTVTFMASAMIRFLVSFLFSAAMYSTLDWSSFFITRTLRFPI